MKQKIVWIITILWVMVAGYGLFIGFGRQATQSDQIFNSQIKPNNNNSVEAAGGQAIQGSASGSDLQGSNSTSQIQEGKNIQGSSVVELLLDN